MTVPATPIHAGRKLGMATGKSRTDARMKASTMTWSEIVQRIHAPQITSETIADYRKLPPERQVAIKDVGCFLGGTLIGPRKKANVQNRDLITLDADHDTPGFETRLTEAIGSYEWAFYTTHKHKPKKPRYRLLFPLTRSVLPAEYAPIARKLAEKIGIEAFDATTDQFERVMFWPSHARDGEYIVKNNEGRWVDPDDILNEYDDWTDVGTWPRSSRHPGVQLYHKAKAEDPRTKSGMIGAFCRVYDIHSAITTFLPDIYTPTHGERYTYTGGSTVNGVHTHEGLWSFSEHESDPCSRQLVNAFDLVRIHKFGEKDDAVKPQTNITKYPSFKAMMAFLEEDEATKAEYVRDAVEGFDAVEDTRWLAKLDMEDGQIKPSLRNLHTITTHDEALKGVMRNDIRHCVSRRCDMPWSTVGDRRNGDPWGNADDLCLRLYIETKYRVEMSAQRAADVVNLIASMRTYNPVCEYLGALVWDGKARIDTMLHRHLRVERNAYTEAVSRKFMCAATARAIQPGIKFDHCLILEGPQGLGKSTFLRTLAVDPTWYGDDVPALKGKEIIENNQGRWIVEMSELQAFSKSKIEQIKGFMSRTVDRARLSYERRAEDFPRCTVFAGTTNDRDYLKDDTGNRRFWPVTCTIDRFDVNALEGERDQLWAEAVYRWKAGEPLYLQEDAVAALAEQEQAARKLDDGGWRARIEAWLDEQVEVFEGQGPPSYRDKVCAPMIWVECFGGDLKDSNRTVSDRIGRAMGQINGWTRAPNPLNFGAYKKQKGWTRDG